MYILQCQVQITFGTHDDLVQIRAMSQGRVIGQTSYYVASAVTVERQRNISQT